MHVFGVCSHALSDAEILGTVNASRYLLEQPPTHRGVGHHLSGGMLKHCLEFVQEQNLLG